MLAPTAPVSADPADGVGHLFRRMSVAVLRVRADRYPDGTGNASSLLQRRFPREHTLVVGEPQTERDARAGRSHCGEAGCLQHASAAGIPCVRHHEDAVGGMQVLERGPLAYLRFVHGLLSMTGCGERGIRQCTGLKRRIQYGFFPTLKPFAIHLPVRTRRDSQCRQGDGRPGVKGAVRLHAGRDGSVREETQVRPGAKIALPSRESARSWQPCVPVESGDLRNARLPPPGAWLTFGGRLHRDASFRPEARVLLRR